MAARSHFPAYNHCTWLSVSCQPCFRCIYISLKFHRFSIVVVFQEHQPYHILLPFHPPTVPIASLPSLQIRLVYGVFFFSFLSWDFRFRVQSLSERCAGLVIFIISLALFLKILVKENTNIPSRLLRPTLVPVD